MPIYFQARAVEIVAVRPSRHCEPRRASLAAGSGRSNPFSPVRQDFEKFRGHKVKIQLRSPLKINDSSVFQKNFTGILEGFEGDFVILKLEEMTQVRIPWDQIKAANLKGE